MTITYGPPPEDREHTRWDVVVSLSHPDLPAVLTGDTRITIIGKDHTGGATVRDEAMRLIQHVELAGMKALGGVEA